MTNQLTRNFFSRGAQTIARELIGTRLVSRIGGKPTSGIIVETEAYLPTNDPACHGTRGKTKSNAAMFGQAGHAYIYPIHAGHCFNVVTGNIDSPEAVLIRAVEPDVGLSTIKQRRNQDKPRLLTTGPSRLCQAFGFNREQDGVDLTRRRLVWVEHVEHETEIPIMTSPRIGVTSGQTLELRFVWKGNGYVSGPKKWRI